jgi:hypothetical protein
VRYEDRGSDEEEEGRDIFTVLGEIGASEVNYDEESILTTGRLSM